jgi:hypothetical protein
LGGIADELTEAEHVADVPITDIAEANSDSHAPAGAEITIKLTLQLDHSRGAGQREQKMPRKIAKKSKRVARRGWSTQDEKELRRHSRSKTPVKDISKALKRSVGALRQKAQSLGIPLGHRRSKKKRA